MNQRLNRLLIAIIIIALGMFVLLRPFIPINIGALGALVGGLALVALYWTKRKAWSLILGVYLVYAAMTQLLWRMPYIGSWRLIGAGFFLVPGAVCFLLYIASGRRAALRFASFLLWFGAFNIVRHWDFLWLRGGSLFLLFMAAACFTIVLFGHWRDWSYPLGWVLLALAGLSAGLYALRYVLAAALVLVGVSMAVKAFRRRAEIRRPDYDPEAFASEQHEQKDNQTEWFNQ